VRDLRGVIEPEDAQIGVLISMEAPTNKKGRCFVAALLLERSV
jgi:hypothetical protein